MAISTGSFVNPNSLPPLDKQLQSLSGSLIGGLSTSAESIASGSASSLLEAGMSFGSALSATAAQVDGIVGGGDPHYTAQAGKITNRALQADLTAMRSAVSPDRPGGALYSVQVSPQGRIGAATMEQNANVIDVYPPDIGKYKIAFEFMDYQRPAPFANVTSAVDYMFVLPVPASLLEYYEVDWQTSNLGLIGDIADAFQQGKNTSLMDSAAEATGAQALRTMEQFDGAIGNISTVAQQAGGAAPNPNITVAFKGPMLRTHNLSWTFAPKTPEESRTVQRIIKNIKRRILPDSGGAGDSTSLLGYPMMVQPKLFPNVVSIDNSNDNVEFSQERPLYDFKRCVIRNMTVNYAPTGTPTFFRGTNLPIFVQLSLALMEIEYFLKDDIQIMSTVKPSADRSGELAKQINETDPQDLYKQAGGNK